MDDRAREILWFWFGRISPEGEVADDKRTRWFRGGEEFDQEIAELFDEDMEAAAEGAYDTWRETPRGCVALCLLLDQFTRNVYRGQPQAFAQDPKACEIALACIEDGSWRDVRPIERVFLLLPLEHAESLPLQERCVDLFRALEQEVPAEQRSLYTSFRDYAEQHHALIARFGRFPYRNEVLGRASTPEEVAFLRETGTSFL
ncbi:MAG: DUF924 domain-containing protein [Myxococcales bacterium]|nr:DUF924 domain-containing protein [Myxococcales bacterium]